MNIDLGIVLTLISYLVIITAYIVRVEGRVKSLENLHLDYKEHLNILQDLKGEIIKLETELKHHCPYQKKSIRD